MVRLPSPQISIAGILAQYDWSNKEEVFRLAFVCPLARSDCQDIPLDLSRYFTIIIIIRTINSMTMDHRVKANTCDYS